MRSDFRAGALAMLCVCPAGMAFAQSAPDEKGFYTGATAGVSAFPSKPKLILGPYTFHSIDTREDDFAWGFIGGYRFGRYFALEAGYTDLGEGTARMVESSGAPVQADLHFLSRGGTLAAVVLYPMRKWEPFLKVGALIEDVELRIDGTESGIPFSLSGSTDGGMRAFFETGVNYRFNDQWKVSVGLSFYNNVGAEDRTGKADIRSTYLGISRQF